MLRIPRLLVSVRNSHEARVAVAAGADIIDVKEPKRGSLGKADRSVILGILEEVKKKAPQLPVSAAWGEAKDFPMTDCRPGELPALSYLKLGLAGLRGNSDWVAKWLAVRDHILDSSAPGSAVPKWIAVAYMDDVIANSPPVDEVIAAAINHGCAGVLFDTFDKSQGRLMDLVPLARLADDLEKLHGAGLLGIAAGKVQLEDVARLAAIGTDVVAVRSAACRGQNRNEELDPAAIHRLLGELRAVPVGVSHEAT